ncbi:MAG TPA: hypothetical protein VN700_16115, partial [Vicinamibacterales bacterium]|nr:hypothetical protein [Vicinamibacterales bacterium]
ITAITESVSKVKGLVDEVSVASRQQAQGIDQVSQAIAQMEKVTQTTAATAEESAAASEELSAQAETAQTVVGKLRMLVGGSDSGSAPVHTAPAVVTKTAGSVVPMAKARVRPEQTIRTAEDELPLEPTGTFGKF